MAKYILVFSVVCLGAVAAQAQWVAVARAASNRIQQMEQRSADGKGGYDVATVIIEAPAQKVYETALQRIQAHAAVVTVVKMDEQKREIAFTNGVQTASLQANSLSDKVTQLVVASTLDLSKQSATSLVVQSIQSICTELKIECTLQTQ